MTADYMLFFFNVKGLSPTALLSLFLLTMMRIGPIVYLAPFLGGKVLPSTAKSGILVVLSVIFLPIVVTTATLKVDLNAALVWLSLKEIMIGFILGFFVSIPFLIVQNAGVFIDYLRGSSMLQAQDPSLQNQASPIGIFYNYILIVLFFQIDGPQYFFNALSSAYSIIPADGVLKATFFTNSSTFWQTAFSLLHEITKISLQLSAPALVAILMAEMFLGIANRLAPQVQIAFLGMSLKSLLGLAILWAGWFFILRQTVLYTNSWLETIRNLIQQFSH